MVELEQKTPESKISKNIRSFEITDGEIIDLEGITDQQWAIYEPLLNALRATRIQTESGKVEVTPMSYKEVKKYFPENPSWRDITRYHKMLSKTLAPSRWSIARNGQWSKKPIGAPWFLRGPDDGIQNKAEPKPKQENIYTRTLSQEKREAALKQFDRLAFGTSLLHQSLSNLTNPDAKAIFTKDPEQAMFSLLPSEIKLEKIIGKKTPLEYFQESIENAVNSMRGKHYQQLSVKQQTIIDLWESLKIQSGQHPTTVIFQHFGQST